MTKLEKIAELRSKAENALRRSFSDHYPKGYPDTSDLGGKLSTNQIETLLENEELQLTKSQLQSELKKYKDLYNYAPVAYFTIDEDGTIVQFNKAAYRFITHQGLQSGRLSVYEVANSHYHKDLKKQIEKVYNTGIDQSGFVKFKDDQAELEPYKVVLSKLIDKNSPRQLCKMIIFNFPDEENLFKAELKEKETAYHELMSNISEGIFYTQKGILNSVNPSLTHILGYSAKELEGKPLWELVTECYQKLVQNIYLQKESKDLSPSYDVKCVRKDGTVFWAELKVKHLSDRKESFGTISDITQRKLTENQLKETGRSLKRSNAAKDKFFSIIAHDLKTPFNTLMGYTYLLMKDYKQYDDQKRESMIRSLYDITKQTFNLLENILVWSRSQTESMPFAPRAINISKLLVENIRLFHPTARAKSISLTSGSEFSDVIVFADPEMIQTVIRNLVTNAIKFTPEKGRVTLGITEDDDEKIIVYVTDNGIGIDPKIKEKLFNIDNNYSARGTHDEKGTGLGLVICKEFVEKNGGEIWFDSKPGKGSRFYFTLYRKFDTID